MSPQVDPTQVHSDRPSELSGPGMRKRAIGYAGARCAGHSCLGASKVLLCFTQRPPALVVLCSGQQQFDLLQFFCFNWFVFCEPGTIWCKSALHCEKNYTVCAQRRAERQLQMAPTNEACSHAWYRWCSGSEINCSQRGDQQMTFVMFKIRSHRYDKRSRVYECHVEKGVQRRLQSCLKVPILFLKCMPVAQ